MRRKMLSKPVATVRAKRVASLAEAEVASDQTWKQIGKSLNLSPREQQMIKGVFNNLTEEALASELRISQHTVHAHMNRMFIKLDVTTRVQLVLCAVKHLLQLTRTDGTKLPPVCADFNQGRCPLRPPTRGRRPRGQPGRQPVAVKRH